MPSLREYRDRIKSVKSTRKITSAMKMVAASKLKKAQDQAEASQPYARTMADMLARVAKNVTVDATSPKLLVGTGEDQRHLLVIVTADRGLCGGFNANILKEARKMIAELKAEGKDVFVICAGKKGRDALKRAVGLEVWQSFVGVTGKARVDYMDAAKISQYVQDKLEDGEFDVCTLLYNEFRSVLVQKPTRQRLIPFDLSEATENGGGMEGKSEESTVTSPYTFEPNEKAILADLLPKNLSVQIFRALLDSAAGEQAARMTAMDNATRNAGDMINGLTLEYNRARQAYITKELIEIISGAEAL